MFLLSIHEYFNLGAIGFGIMGGRPGFWVCVAVVDGKDFIRHWGIGRGMSFIMEGGLEFLPKDVKM